jgi:hypothetical protein
VAEILEFPTRERQAFLYLEEQLTKMLKDRGADDTLINFAIASLTDVYSELQRESDCHFEVRLPERLSQADAIMLQEDIAQGIEQLRKEHHDLTLRLAARLILTELKLFQHERDN